MKHRKRCGKEPPGILPQLPNSSGKERRFLHFPAWIFSRERNRFTFFCPPTKPFSFFLADFLVQVVPKNSKEAFRFYSESASLGFPRAKLKQGLMYHYGQGCQKDDVKSLSLLKEAAEQSQDLVTQSEAAYFAGISYSSGYVERDLELAFKFFEKSAQLGHPESCFVAGKFLSSGVGAEQNHHLAFQYFEKAASRGHMESCYNLGAMYCEGLGTQVNHEKAFHYWLFAAEKVSKPSLKSETLTCSNFFHRNK